MAAGVQFPYEVVDAHQHFWDTATYTYPWIDAIPPAHQMAPLKESYFVKDFEKDVADCNVVKTVHVQAEVAGDPVVETVWLEELAKSNLHQFPNAIVGYVDLSLDNVKETIDRHLEASPRFVGVRQMLNWDPNRSSRTVTPQDYLANPKWQENIALVEAAGLTFDLHVEPRQLFSCAELAKRHPGLTFILDHIGCPCDRDVTGFNAWSSGIAALALQQNVICKVSGLLHPTFILKDEWSKASLQPWVEAVIREFGPSRCIFGSNFPVDGVVGSYHDMLWTLQSILDTLNVSSDDQKAIFGYTATRVYKITY